MSSKEISSLSLKRLFNRAGIKRVKHESYDQLAKYMTNFTKQVLTDTNILISNRKNKIMTEEDIKNGLIVNKLLHIIDNIHNGGNYEQFCHGNTSQCGVEGTIIPTSEPGKMTGGTFDRITNTFCNGNTSQCFFDDVVDCNMSGGGLLNNDEYVFSIPNTQFQRFLNTLHFNNMKITKSSVNYLQYFVEQNAIKYLIDKKKDMEDMNQKQFDLLEENNIDSDNSI